MMKRTLVISCLLVLFSICSIPGRTAAAQAPDNVRTFVGYYNNCLLGTEDETLSVWDYKLNQLHNAILNATRPDLFNDIYLDYDPIRHVFWCEDVSFSFSTAPYRHNLYKIDATTGARLSVPLQYAYWMKGMKCDYLRNNFWFYSPGGEIYKFVLLNGKLKRTLSVSLWIWIQDMELDLRTGNVWVASSDRIVLLNGVSGKIESEITGFGKIMNIDVNNYEPSLWVADYVSNKVVKIPTGTLKNKDKAASFPQAVLGRRPLSVTVNTYDDSCWIVGEAPKTHISDTIWKYDKNMQLDFSLQPGYLKVTARTGILSNEPQAIIADPNDGSALVVKGGGDWLFWNRIEKSGKLLYPWEWLTSDLANGNFDVFILGNEYMGPRPTATPTSVPGPTPAPTPFLRHLPDLRYGPIQIWINDLLPAGSWGPLGPFPPEPEPYLRRETTTALELKKTELEERIAGVEDSTESWNLEQSLEVVNLGLEMSEALRSGDELRTGELGRSILLIAINARLREIDDLFQTVSNDEELEALNTERELLELDQEYIRAELEGDADRAEELLERIRELEDAD